MMAHTQTSPGAHLPAIMYALQIIRSYIISIYILAPSACCQGTCVPSLTPASPAVAIGQAPTLQRRPHSAHHCAILCRGSRLQAAHRLRDTGRVQRLHHKRQHDFHQYNVDILVKVAAAAARSERHMEALSHQQIRGEHPGKRRWHRCDSKVRMLKPRLKVERANKQSIVVAFNSLCVSEFRNEECM